MNIRTKEVNLVEKIPSDLLENSLPELGNSELVLIGGGVGEIAVG